MPKASEIFSKEDLEKIKHAVKLFGGRVTAVEDFTAEDGPRWIGEINKNSKNNKKPWSKNEQR